MVCPELVEAALAVVVVVAAVGGQGLVAAVMVEGGAGKEAVVVDVEVEVVALVDVEVEVEVVAVVASVVGGVIPRRPRGRRLGRSDSHHSLILGEEAQAESHALSIAAATAVQPMVRVVLHSSASFASLRASIRFIISSTCDFLSSIQSRCSVSDWILLLFLDTSCLRRKV